MFWSFTLEYLEEACPQLPVSAVVFSDFGGHGCSLCQLHVPCVTKATCKSRLLKQSTTLHRATVAGQLLSGNFCAIPSRVELPQRRTAYPLLHNRRSFYKGNKALWYLVQTEPTPCCWLKRNSNQKEVTVS